MFNHVKLAQLYVDYEFVFQILYFVFVVGVNLPLSTKQVVEAAGDFVPSVLLPPIFQSQTHLR